LSQLPGDGNNAHSELFEEEWGVSIDIARGEVFAYHAIKNILRFFYAFTFIESMIYEPIACLRERLLLAGSEDISVRLSNGHDRLL